jgi:hypothetical protein
VRRACRASKRGRNSYRRPFVRFMGFPLRGEMNCGPASKAARRMS